MKPDLRKLEAIQNLQLPKTKHELQSFLGMINYIHKYTPEAVQVCKPLHELISIQSDYKRYQHHTDAFNKAKTLMNKDCYLCFYNPNKSLFIETDASKVRLGRALLQTEKDLKEYEIEYYTLPMLFQLKAVMYASKSFMSTEQNYSNIGLEALGVLNSLKNFHHYCFCHVIHIISDHRPLLSLMHKDVSNASPRLQRHCYKHTDIMLLCRTALARRCILLTIYLEQAIN